MCLCFGLLCGDVIWLCITLLLGWAPFMGISQAFSFSQTVHEDLTLNGMCGCSSVMTDWASVTMDGWVVRTHSFWIIPNLVLIAITILLFYFLDSSELSMFTYKLHISRKICSTSEEALQSSRKSSFHWIFAEEYIWWWNKLSHLIQIILVASRPHSRNGTDIKDKRFVKCAIAT